jgi:hypothetical protein
MNDGDHQRHRQSEQAGPLGEDLLARQHGIHGPAEIGRQPQRLVEATLVVLHGLLGLYERLQAVVARLTGPAQLAQSALKRSRKLAAFARGHLVVQLTHTSP